MMKQSHHSMVRALVRCLSTHHSITLPNGLAYQQPTGLFINNKFLANTGKTINVINPSTEELITRVSSANSADVDDAVDAAERAFKFWNSSNPLYRAQVLNKIADKMEERKEILSALETANNGKTLALASGDVNLSIDYFRYVAGLCSFALDGRTLSNLHDRYVNYTMREPIGVVAGLIPWNFPLLMLAWKIAPALAAGNTMLLKPASATPLSALLFADICKDVGVPPGVINIVPGSGSECGEAILNHPRIRKIAFTGSTEVGKHVMHQSASNIKKVSLELGGKSPHIVFDDVDFKKAFKNLSSGIFLNAGQICSSGSRIYVQDSIYEKFLTEFKHFVEREITVGDPFSNVFQGAITNKEQFNTIMRYIDIGKKSGAKLLTGGERVGGKGLFIKPTIFYDVPQDAQILREEIFGPVATISPFSTVEEAVSMANNSEFGLGAGIQTKNIDRALEVSKLIKTGTVWINCYNDFEVGLPFGGVKQSGVGREMGVEVFESYTQVKSVRIKLSG